MMISKKCLKYRRALSLEVTSSHTYQKHTVAEALAVFRYFIYEKSFHLLQIELAQFQ